MKTATRPCYPFQAVEGAYRRGQVNGAFKGVVTFMFGSIIGSAAMFWAFGARLACEVVPW